MIFQIRNFKMVDSKDDILNYLIRKAKAQLTTQQYKTNIHIEVSINKKIFHNDLPSKTIIK